MSKSRSEISLIVALAFALLGACEPNACVRESDCTSGFVCRTGRCALAADAGSEAGPIDGGPVTPDAGHDAATVADAGTDTGVDAGTDAGNDASVDAGNDASVDAGIDADIDTGH